MAINGWEIKFKKEGGKENYEKYFKNVETIVVGVVGNGNKGKSFLLKKLCDYNILMGHKVKTEGLSIIYRKTEKQNIAILDSAGLETPLLENKNDNNNNNDDSDFEEYSRDKLVTELYIQQFILWKSNIVILLVGNITLSDQKLYTKIKRELLAIQENQKMYKKLFVVHNLQNIYHKVDVDDYIENVLKNLYNIKLEEIKMYEVEKQDGFDIYFLEKDNINIIHLLLINDYCGDSKYYNINTIFYLNQAIGQVKCREAFPILENSKKFLLEISEQIMDNKLSEKDIEITKEKETEKLKVNQEIQLKNFYSR